MTLASFLKKNGVDVNLIIPNSCKDLFRGIDRFNPKLVAFSCSSPDMPWVRRTVKALKKHSNLPVVLGGSHPSIYPDVIKEPNIDYICLGEGEYPLLELIKRIENKKSTKVIKNIWAKSEGKIYKNPLRSLVKNLDSLPKPDRSIYDKYPGICGSSIGTFMIGRGCPFNCSYCANSSLKSLYPLRDFVRYKSPEYVIEEVESLNKIYNFKTIYFHDSVFPYDKKWLDKFLPLYKTRIGLPFTINARPETINFEILCKLKMSGCMGVSLGIETGDENIRRHVLNKHISNMQLIKSAREIRKAGLKLLTYNMLGLPKTKLKDSIKTVKLNSMIRPDYILCNFFNPFPGLKINEHILGKEKNKIKTLDYTSEEPLINKRNKVELVKLHSLFYILTRLNLNSHAIRLILKTLPLGVCKLFGNYNRKSYMDFHEVESKEVDFYFKGLG